MTIGRVFVVMQIGQKDSPERRRADEIYNFIIRPSLADFDLEAYRADLDPSPGGITVKMLSELLGAKLVIADLTGRNPNVFYELGIAHSFAKPLISIADSASSLPFDAKDERVIALGEYGEAGLTYAQGEVAKKSLQDSLEVVLAEGYDPPSPLREVAANQSLDDLAPENPVAAELSQMREALQDVAHVKVLVQALVRRTARQPHSPADYTVLREFIEDLVRQGRVGSDEIRDISTTETSDPHDSWVDTLRIRIAFPDAEWKGGYANDDEPF